jgi:hypothetical protein
MFKEHLRKETEMSKSIKSSGWAFILGGFSFATILTGSDPIAFSGSLISTILLAVGMLGLRGHYDEKAGGLGRNILLIGVIATVLFYIGLASLAVLSSSGTIPGDQLAAKGLWILIFGGPAVALLGLTLFGLSALRRKPLHRLNWLPVFAGIWYPAVYFFLAGYLFTHDGEYPGQYHAAMQMIFLIQFLALCVFGAVLNDTSQEMATA